tara:strand:- start:4371 stop:4817 length:447 start_codon:yes stop_codon:yes gene_type:complete
MIITDLLIGEHGAFRALLDEIEDMATFAGDVAQIESATTVLAAEIKAHASLEEELLFSALEPHLESNDLLTKVHAEHREIRQGLERIEEARDLDEALNSVRETLAILRQHFDNEEEFFYAAARQVLDDETLNRLGETWKKVRSGPQGI